MQKSQQSMRSQCFLESPQYLFDSTFHPVQLLLKSRELVLGPASGKKTRRRQTYSFSAVILFDKWLLSPLRRKGSTADCKRSVSHCWKLPCRSVPTFTPAGFQLSPSAQCLLPPRHSPWPRASPKTLAETLMAGEWLFLTWGPLQNARKFLQALTLTIFRAGFKRDL